MNVVRQTTWTCVSCFLPVGMDVQGQGNIWKCEDCSCLVLLLTSDYRGVCGSTSTPASPHQDCHAEACSVRRVSNA